MIHGPFPVRVWRLLGGLGCVGVGLFAILLATPQVLACGPSGADCRLERPNTQPYRFSRSAMVPVHVVEVRGNKGGKYGVPVLTLPAGEFRLRQVSPMKAEEFAHTVNEALARGDAFEASLYESWWAIGFLGVIFAMGVGLVVTALRGIGRYHLRLDVMRRELSVERKILGFSRTLCLVSTSDVVDVEVDWARDRDFFHARGQVGDTVGRLVLATAHGDRRPVTDGRFRGYTLHLRAAEELRALLHCPARGHDAVLRHDADARLFHPPPPALGGGNRFFAAWLGLCCGSLAGMALYGVVGLALGIFNMRDSVDGFAVSLGAGGGALGGVALAMYLTRPRPPR